MFLERITIKNFAGIDFQEIKFTSPKTIIKGANGAGKSTIANAYYWCLTGKDMFDRQNFNIKNTADPARNRNPHEVTVVIGGTKLKRVYLEDWVKPKGEPEPIFKGNVVKYYIDDLPVSSTEYNNQVATIICPADKFRLLSVAGHFTSLNWKEQRAILMDMAPDIEEMLPDESIRELLANKGEDEAREYLQKKIKSLKADIKDHEARIAENKRNMPNDQPWEELEDQLNALKIEEAAELKKHDEAHRKWKADWEAALVEYDRIRDAHANMYQESAAKVSQTRERIAKLQQLIHKYELIVAGTFIDSNLSRKNSLKVRLDSLRKEYSLKSKEQQPAKGICPTCLQETNTDEIIAEFVKAKEDALKAIASEGEQVKAELGQAEAETAEAKEQFRKDQEMAKSSIAACKAELKEAHDYLAELTKNIPEGPEYPTKPESPSKEALEAIQARVRDMELILAEQKAYIQMAKRTKELESELKHATWEIAERERQLFALQQFANDKMVAVTNALNGLFSFVKWRLFKEQVNGGLADDCEATWNDVGYSALSTGEKIVVDIDIINAMSKHYGIALPVFIDNAESLTTDLKTESQTICLFVHDGPLEFIS